VRPGASASGNSTPCGLKCDWTGQGGGPWQSMTQSRTESGRGAFGLSVPVTVNGIARDNHPAYASMRGSPGASLKMAPRRRRITVTDRGSHTGHAHRVWLRNHFGGPLMLRRVLAALTVLALTTATLLPTAGGQPTKGEPGKLAKDLIGTWVLVGTP